MSSAQSNAPSKLISQLLIDDVDLRDVVEEFVAGLDDRIQEISKAFEKLDWDQLGTLAHRLKGAGGSYGYPDLSKLATEMEKAFRNHQGEQFAGWVEQLTRLSQAAKAGLADAAPSS